MTSEREGGGPGLKRRGWFWFEWDTKKRRESNATFAICISLLSTKVMSLQTPSLSTFSLLSQNLSSGAVCSFKPLNVVLSLYGQRSLGPALHP